MTKYKQWFIDFGFERYYPTSDWLFCAWSGTYTGRPCMEISTYTPVSFDSNGEKVQTLAGIRVLGFYARIGINLTTYPYAS